MKNQVKITCWIFLLGLLFNCSTRQQKEGRTSNVVETKSTEKTAKEEPSFIESPPIEEIPKSRKTKPFLPKKLQHSNNRFSAVPLYFNSEGKRYYVVSDQPIEHYEDLFNKYQYGVVNDSFEVILPIINQKIYNPNITLKDCIEFKKDGKIGLLNLEILEVLDAQFDYILTDNGEAKSVAYGYKENQWYEIDSERLNLPKRIADLPINALSGLSFDSKALTANKMFYTNPGVYRFSPQNGMIILPSYLEYWNLSYYNELFDVFERGNDGTDEANIHIKKGKSFTEKITSFFATFYETGVDARDYATSSENILIYNSEVDK